MARISALVATTLVMQRLAHVADEVNDEPERPAFFAESGTGVI